MGRKAEGRNLRSHYRFHNCNYHCGRIRMFGICSAVNFGVSSITALEIEDKIAQEIQKYRAEFGKMKKITDRMLESGQNFDKAINVAIGILTKEIDLIIIWNQSA